jgi:hypothetical protein
LWKLADFVALYRGRTVSEAEIVAVSAEPRLVRRFFAELLSVPLDEQNGEHAEHPKPTLEVVVGDED